MAQLAQFASLELAQNANAQLESLLLAQAAANQTALTSFVGKDVVFRTDSITLEAGRAAQSGAQLAADAESVTAVVTDAKGKTVRTMQLGRRRRATSPSTGTARRPAASFCLRGRTGCG